MTKKFVISSLEVQLSTRDVKFRILFTRHSPNLWTNEFSKAQALLCWNRLTFIIRRWQKSKIYNFVKCFFVYYVLHNLVVWYPSDLHICKSNKKQSWLGSPEKHTPMLHIVSVCIYLHWSTCIICLVISLANMNKNNNLFPSLANQDESSLVENTYIQA